MDRAAVVIGVNRTGKLPALRAAVSGAKKFGHWLKQEGFDVNLLVDDKKPVTLARISGQISELVRRGTLRQLVIFFSGHGFLNVGRDETWLLSNAPLDANEAINVAENVVLARESGIPSVVMISDACRSTPESIQSSRVRGSLIFPNEEVTSNPRPEIDRFFATLPGSASFEIAVGGTAKQYRAVFTDCFLQAYVKPDVGMARQVLVEGEQIRVIPNRNLKEYLRREVPARMQELKVPVRQLPDAIVESGEDVYLGKVAPRPDSEKYGIGGVAGLLVMPVRTTVDVGDVAQYAFARAIGSRIDVPIPSREAIDRVASESGFNAAVDGVRTSEERGPDHFESTTGLKVIGTRVIEFLGLGVRVDKLYEEPEASYIRINTPFPSRGAATSVILRFADGSGTVVAGLGGYIGTISVEGGRVANVSYVPSTNSDRWAEYVEERSRLRDLRTIVAAAARFGAFRVDKRDAGTVADRIRFLKAVDPTLGLYSAYAYAEVGISREVESVREIMANDISAMLFDVAMLAGEMARGDRGANLPIVPFCPMLAQGWNLLRVKKARLHPIVDAARDHLLPSLWTTFDSAGMDRILRAARDIRDTRPDRRYV
ncbi:MAG: caspase family protein [Chloroflexi bacterium]|nr:caspase family protein [Chloroflexota bacterium]